VVRAALTARADHRPHITTILIVGDDPVQRRLLGHTVERFGYRALVATSGRGRRMLARPEGEGWR
jgi:CheY-like chemotaxis protein